MLCICVGDVMDAVFSVCIAMRGAVGGRVWEGCVFSHADVVCLCLVFILRQSSMLRSAWLKFVNAGRRCKRRPYGRGILQYRSHDCPVGSNECLLLFTPFCCDEGFYYLCRYVCVYIDVVNMCYM